MELLEAARNGDTQQILSLLSSGASVHTKSETSCTALHWAARYNQSQAIELLLQNHANINATDSLGYTPLHWAVLRGKPLLAK